MLTESYRGRHVAADRAHSMRQAKDPGVTATDSMDDRQSGESVIPALSGIFGRTGPWDMRPIRAVRVVSFLTSARHEPIRFSGCRHARDAGVTTGPPGRRPGILTVRQEAFSRRAPSSANAAGEKAPDHINEIARGEHDRRTRSLGYGFLEKTFFSGLPERS